MVVCPHRRNATKFMVAIATDCALLSWKSFPYLSGMMFSAWNKRASPYATPISSAMPKSRP